MKRWIMSLGVFVMATSSVPAAETARPNIVVILADDLGFSDLGCYGSEIAAPPLPGHSVVPALTANDSVDPRLRFLSARRQPCVADGQLQLVSAMEDKSAWDLYDLATDRGEQRNLAAAQPERVREMAARWQELQEQFTRDAGDAK